MKRYLPFFLILLFFPLFSACFFPEPDITIESEEIVVEIYKNDALISVKLIFYNHNIFTHDLKIGFPGRDYPAYVKKTGTILYNKIDLFSVHSGGSNLPYTVTEYTYKDPLLSEYYTSEWFFYTDSFPARSYHEMNINYRVKTVFNPFPLESGTCNRLCIYIIHTALSWGNTIKSLCVTIKNREPGEIDNVTFHLKNDCPVNNKESISFNYNNIIPDEDIFVFYDLIK